MKYLLLSILLAATPAVAKAKKHKKVKAKPVAAAVKTHHRSNGSCCGVDGPLFWSKAQKAWVCQGWNSCN